MRDWQIVDTAVCVIASSHESQPCVLALQILGCKEYHRSCTDNLYEGMSELGLTPPETPSPLNLWMNVPWDRVSLSYSSPALSPFQSIPCAFT